MNQLHAPNSIPHGVEILWHEADKTWHKPYITGAEFHNAELRLNHGVDLSPQPPLERLEAEQILLMSAGMTRQERSDYLEIPFGTVNENTEFALAKLGAKSHHAIRRSFEAGVIEVTKPLALPEQPAAEIHNLVEVLCKYPTVIGAHTTEPMHIKRLLGETAASYGLRGVHDLMTWAHAVMILDSSQPVYAADPATGDSRPDLFAWHQTADGFVVRVFNKDKSCAELEFEGRRPHTAWLRAIIAEGGRIAVKNVFDIPDGRVHLSQAELGALAIATLGGSLKDIRRLDIPGPATVLRGLYEKIGVPNRISRPYAPARAARLSFEKEIMVCELPPKITGLSTLDRTRLRPLARYDSHQHAAEEMDMAPRSVASMLSKLNAHTPFPTVAGSYLMRCAIEAYENPNR